jgi:phage shock protein PspC (stress-responsive transcriptional regulator)
MLRGGPGDDACGMTTATPPPPPPVDAPAAEQQNRPTTQLRRSATDKMLGGVCGGLAEYSGIDPLLWRVGAVALTLVGPGIFIYLLLWVLMEPAPGVPSQDLSPVDRLVGQLHDKLTGYRRPSAS